MSSAPALPRKCTFPLQDWTVLSRCWHPVAVASEITPDRPHAAQVLDQELVLYRDGAGITVAADLCVHRGAPLSMGTMCEGHVTCAYHGYRYDGGGRCRMIPAHPGGAIPSKLTLRLFNSVERYGLVWVQLDSREERPLPEFPEFGAPGFQVFHVPPLDWAASAGRQVESFCDVAHFAFVHPVTFAAKDPVVPRYEVSPTPTGVHAEFVSQVGNISDPSAAHQVWRRIYDLHLPFTAHLTVHFPHGGRFAILNASCPVSARKTRVFAVIAREFDHEQPIAEAIAFQQRVYGEDQRIVERQNPEDLPIDLDEEVHVRADRTSVEYRRQLAKLGLGREFTA